MSFCGYKYRFGLYAAHSNIIQSEEKPHFHNFTINLYIGSSKNKSDDNFKVEQSVMEWLKQFQGEQLNQMELFIGADTTVEGMGDTFFDPLYDLINKLGFELLKLDIFENPIRVYTVSKKLLDSSVNEISSIPTASIPLIHIDNPNELLTDVNDEINEEVALTREAVEVTTLQENSDKIIENNQIIHKENKYIKLLKLIIGLVFVITLAFLTMYIVKISGRYPQGSDTFCHLYRADLILKNIKDGNWYPLYDSTWYNGVEIMRYWGPIPLYLIAGLEWFIHGSVMDAYVLYLGVLIFIGGCGWLLWGYRYNRVGVSILLGLLWFYMPENMRVVIYEGNLPRGVINAFLPFFFYYVWRVMEDKKKNAIWPLMFVTTLITLCHLGITIMLLVTVILFVVIYTSINPCNKWGFGVLGACASGVMLAGVWVVPALIGGAASGSSTNQVMKNFFESAFISLNPMYHIRGDGVSFYFGLSVFVICLIGVVFGSKKVKPGFIITLILFLCTTNSILSLFIKLPFSQFLWMIRFIPIGLSVAMVSFLMWKQLKTRVVVLFSILLLVDCLTSVQYIYVQKDERIENVQAELEVKAENMLLTEAKEVTKQRMALLDLSKYGSFAPYYITGVGKSVNYTFGAGWEGASTASNIVKLNTATENGWYVYLFDRSLELGNDTVLIPIGNLKEQEKDLELVINAAKISGYQLIKYNGTSMLFHKDVTRTNQFGVITKYENIAIGDSASGISMIFPSFKEGSNPNINDYTFEELSQYHTIYLSGFTYDSKEKAEALLLKLSESDISIYIDMNRIPVSRTKKQMELFGVNAQSIGFTETYPELVYDHVTYKSLDYTSDIDKWNTVYLQGLDKTEGYGNTPEKRLPFYGTSKNENLHFIGLNIIYYLQTTRDSKIKELVESSFRIDETSVPSRQIVPLSIQKFNHKIEVSSDYDNVNTTLSSIDIFSSNNDYRTENNMIVVDSGLTVIDIGYPHFKLGIVVTMFGVLLAVLTLVSMGKKKENEN